MQCFKKILILAYILYYVNSCTIGPQVIRKETYLHDKENATSTLRIVIKKVGDNLAANADYQCELDLLIWRGAHERWHGFDHRSMHYIGQVDLDGEVKLHLVPDDYVMGGKLTYWENIDRNFRYGYGSKPIKFEDGSQTLRLKAGETQTLVFHVSTTGEFHLADSIWFALTPPIINAFRFGTVFYTRNIELTYEESRFEEWKK